MSDFSLTYNQTNANPMGYKFLRINQSSPFIESEEPESLDLCDEEPQDCCSDDNFKLLVLADPVFTDAERNDFSSFLYKVFLNNTITFSLEKWNVSAWDEMVADLSAGSYGTYYEPGILQTGFHIVKFTGYKLEWRNVLIAFGEGVYRVKASGTFFGNSWDDCSRIFCLKEYSVNSANQTVRFEWHNNGIVSYANPETGTFKKVDYENIDWHDMIRLTGAFGFPEDQQEVIDLSYQVSNHLEIERIRDKTNYLYKFNSGYYPSWVHYLIKDIAFKSNSLLVTDYNKLAKHNFVRKAIVKEPDGYKPDYEHVYQKKYKVQVNFRDKLDDLGYQKYCNLQSENCAPVTIKDQNGNILEYKPSGTVYVDGNSLTCDDVTVTDGLASPSTIDVASGGTYTCTPISSATCAQLNDVDSGLTPTQINNVQRQQPTRTGQTTSYRTGDDGDLELGLGTAFSTLSCNNIFGNTNRFTDETGAQTYTNNFVLDHLTGLMWYRVSTSGTWNQAIDGSLASTRGGFTDWFLPNKNQIITICNYSSTMITNYSPFNININSVATRLWTSTTDPNGTTSAFSITAVNFFQSFTKTSTHSYIYCRQFIPSDFGL